MGHEHARKCGKDLDRTREALATWRRSYGGRGRPIPEALWSEAADVAGANGVAEVARALRLDPRKLAKLVEGRAESAPRSDVERAQFVELGGHDLGEPREQGKAVLELVGREGDRVRVEVVGGVGSVVDLVALARAFWSRSA
jgi:hypothetical protein